MIRAVTCPCGIGRRPGPSPDAQAVPDRLVAARKVNEADVVVKRWTESTISHDSWWDSFHSATLLSNAPGTDAPAIATASIAVWRSIWAPPIRSWLRPAKGSCSTSLRSWPSTNPAARSCPLAPAVSHMATTMQAHPTSGFPSFSRWPGSVVTSFVLCGRMLRCATSMSPAARLADKQGAVGVPGGITYVEKRAVFSSVERAGASQVWVARRPRRLPSVAACRSPGLASMVCNVGGGTTEGGGDEPGRYGGRRASLEATAWIGRLLNASARHYCLPA